MAPHQLKKFNQQEPKTCRHSREETSATPEATPEAIPSRQSRLPGGCCLWGCGGCVASIILGICVVWAIVFGISYYFVSDQEALYKKNNGLGSEDQPISSDTVLIFADYELHLSKLIVPADRQVLQMSEENKELPDGEAYALLWAELKCTKSDDTTCSTSQPQITLIDEHNKEYNPPLLVYLETPFAEQTVKPEERAEGWIAFVYADDWRNVHLIRVNDGFIRLHTQRPYD